MNENQRNFLDELAELFDKYSIDQVVSINEGRITFESNGSTLTINAYCDGVFRGIYTTANHYEPRREGVNDAP